jgi:hypothetical protein
MAPAYHYSRINNKILLFQLERTKSGLKVRVLHNMLQGF